MMPAPPHKQLKLGVSIVSYDIISRLIYDTHTRTQSGTPARAIERTSQDENQDPGIS
jgi:hypothetical protein